MDEKLIRQIAREVADEVLKGRQDHLMTKGQMIKEYFGISNNGADEAIKSRDFPRVYIKGRETPMYSSKAVEKWIAEHVVYGYERRG